MSNLVTSEEEGLIFLDGCAKSKTTLAFVERSPPVLSLVGEIIKEIGRFEISPSKIDVAVAVKLVGSAFCDHIQDHAAGLAVLCVVAVGENLELLNFVDGSPQRVARRADLVGDVAAIDVH